MIRAYATLALCLLCLFLSSCTEDCQARCHYEYAADDYDYLVLYGLDDAYDGFSAANNERLGECVGFCDAP